MTTVSLFLQEEPIFKKTLTSLLKFLPNMKFIDSIQRIYQYSDEPKFFQYSAKFHDLKGTTNGTISNSRRAGGSSFFSEELAYLKCLAETIERYTCTVYKKNHLTYGNYKKLNKKAFPIEKYSGFSEEQKQLSENSMFRFDENTNTYWVWVNSLSQNKKFLVPAHLVYYNYKFIDGEKAIYVPISTGAAGGGCLAAAIVRGIFEIIERDSFIIAYLNKVSCPKIKLKAIKDKRVKQLLEVARRYRLDVHIIDLTSDLTIPSFATILVDKTGIGSGVLTGLKSHIDPIEAIIGSFEETLHTRCWMRQIHEDDFKKYLNIIPNKIKTVEERGMYWYPFDRVKELAFWLESDESKIIPNRCVKRRDYGKMLKQLVLLCKHKKLDILYKDLTPDFLKNTGYKVVKVIIPQLQPHYQYEKQKPLGGTRLSKPSNVFNYQEKNLDETFEYNVIPHPFL